METNMGVLLTATVVPFVFIGGLSFLIIRHMLNKKALALLNNEGKNKATRLNKLVNKILKNAKAVTKFKYSYLTQSLGKFLVFLLGIFFASSLIIMGTMLYDFSDKMTKDYYESKDYQYESYVDFTKELPIIEKDQEKFLDAKVLYKEGVISVKGIETNNELFKLHDKSQTDITSKLENGVIVNKALALEKSFEVGDEVKLNGLENENTYEIVSIEDNNSSAAMYMDVEELSMLISGEEELYIGIYTKDAPSEDYQIIIMKSDILKQSEAMQGFMTIMIYGMMIGAILIAVLILYILTTLTVEDNLYSISLLKVIGYSQREIRIMMLNSYLVYSIIAYLIAVPITVMLMNYFTVYLVQEFNMFMPMEFNLIGAVLGLVFIVVIFLLGTANANRQIKKISLQEVLKSYRE
jgi:putative ABC transport system permease protein